jgi:sterol desaturase/sphingolipid hydroxylase (fatty acid hydroxylase superfamily)
LPKIVAAIVALGPVFSVIAGYFLIGYVLELLRPAERRQPLRRVLFNLFYVVPYVVSFALLAPALATWLPTPPGLLAIDWGRTLYGAIAQNFLFLLGYDFFYYWWHRAQHSSATLWAVHRLHHTERALNVTTSVRHHWLEETLRPLVVLLPLGWLLHFEPIQFAVVGLMFAAWPFFIHLNVKLNLGQFGRIFTGPQYHRIHHSIESAHMNRNFAAFFPVWDYLFGTAYHPHAQEFPATGVVDDNGEPKSSLREAAVGPFLTWFRALQSRR